jgi:hypothetical protein
VEAGGSKVLEAEQVKGTYRAQRGVKALREVYPEPGFLYITCKLCSYGIERYQQRCVTPSKKTQTFTLELTSSKSSGRFTRWKDPVAGHSLAAHGCKIGRTCDPRTNTSIRGIRRGCALERRRTRHTIRRCDSSSAWYIRTC